MDTIENGVYITTCENGSQCTHYKNCKLAIFMIQYLADDKYLLPENKEKYMLMMWECECKCECDGCSDDENN